jgi:hypothetical protein
MRFLGAANVLQRGFHVCRGHPTRNFERQHDVKIFKKHHGLLIRLVGEGMARHGQNVSIRDGQQGQDGERIQVLLYGSKSTRKGTRPVVDVDVPPKL